MRGHCSLQKQKKKKTEKGGFEKGPTAAEKNGPAYQTQKTYKSWTGRVVLWESRTRRESERENDGC